MSYLIYVLPIIFIAIYFEIIGRTIAYKLKIGGSSIYLPLGFAMVLALGYILTSFLSFLNVNFYILFLAYLLIFLGTIVYTTINIKKIDKHTQWKTIGIVALLDRKSVV